MAEGKKSFLFYCEWYEIFKSLSDKGRAKLIMQILSYVNDEHPDQLGGEAGVAFIPIKQQLKRDLDKWRQYVEKQKINGSKGGRPGSPEKPKKGLGYLGKIKKPKKGVEVKEEVKVEVEEVILYPPDEKQLFPIEQCLEIAMRDSRWMKSNGNPTKADLEKFNKVLEQRGDYQRNPADWKKHYPSWLNDQAKGKTEQPVRLSLPSRTN